MTVSSISISVPGKIHLMGEHAVVYGNPALLASVDLRCQVSLKPEKKDLILISIKNSAQTKSISVKEVTLITKNANDLWEKYKKNNDSSFLTAIIKSELDYAVIAIGETLKFYKQNLPSGFSLEISSEIPIGSGLGSSASLAVGIAAVVSLFLGQKFDKNVINSIALYIEQKIHGNPSGGDNTAVCFGGLVWFEKEKGLKELDCTIPKAFANNFVLLNSGKPDESTGKIVSSVKAWKEKNPVLFNKFLEDQEIRTIDLLTALKNADEELLFKSIKKGEQNLEIIGVVSDSAKAIIRKIEQSGGVAKISGAGGRANGSGILLAYHKEKEKLMKLFYNLAIPYFNTKIGVEGVKVRQ